MKKYLLKIILALLSPLVFISFLISSEYFLRLRDPDYLVRISNNDINYLSTFSETLGWNHQKKYTYTVGDHKVTINGKGTRGEEVSYEKKDGIIRVLMLGDSITFGYGVADEQTFSYLLDEKSEKIEVINAGVQGYGTDQELIYLKNEGLKYQPDVIVLNFTLSNDIVDNSFSKSVYDKTYPKPYYILENDNLVLKDDHLKLHMVKKVVFLLSQKSVLFNKLLSALKVNSKYFSQKLIVEDHDIGIDQPLITYRLIKEISEIAAKQKVPFILAIFPGKDNYNTDSSELQQLLKQEMFNNITIINFYQSLEEKGYGIDRYEEIAFDKTMHLTSKGHQIVADVFYDNLRNIFTTSAAFYLPAKN